MKVLKDAFNLLHLLPHFRSLAAQYLGSPKMDRIEHLMKSVRDGSEPFSIKHIEILRDRNNEYWHFLDFWDTPIIQEDEIDRIKWEFKNLKALNKSIIKKLFDITKNIEVVSCILRFIAPTDYAIISPPVENLLNIRGFSHIDRYLNYLNDMRELKKYYGFVRIADVDMALWTLARILNEDNLKEQYPYSDCYEAYKRTPNFVKKLLAKNSLSAIYEDKPIILAELLLDTDHILSGIIAGRILEMKINAMCLGNDISLKKIYDRKIYDKGMEHKLQDLLGKSIISPEEKIEMKTYWKRRGICVHGEDLEGGGPAEPNKEEIGQMVDGIKRFMEEYS